MKLQNLSPWLATYLAHSIRKFPTAPLKTANAPIDLILCIADHFEPRVGQASLTVERRRMALWEKKYPILASRHCDSDGVPPQHTWFFPVDEYWDEHLAALARLQRLGYGEVEVHLHHGYDTSEGLREHLERARKIYAQHGVLSCGKTDASEHAIRYGFIHGNWALDNSGGDPRWCGVNDELQILEDTGCYADFTFPSLMNPTQPRTINALYYAYDDPSHPKSYDSGQPVQVGRTSHKGLMLVTGPVGLNWSRRKYRLLPTVENSDISVHHPPTSARIRLWINAHIHVWGQPNWVFIKLHTHGASDGTLAMFTTEGSPVDQLFSELESRYADGKRYRLHYVTAREMYNIIKAAEAGCTGNPHAYRDYLLVPQHRYIRPAMSARPKLMNSSRSLVRK